MKKAEMVFSTILVPLDYLALIAAGLSAYLLRYSRFYAENIREVVFSLKFGDYFKYVLIFALLYIIILALTGIYSMRPERKIFTTLGRIFFACCTGSLLVIVSFFFTRELFSSRFIVLGAWGLAIVYISLVHLIMGAIQKKLYERGVGAHKVVLVGGDEVGLQLKQEFHDKPKLGYKIVSHVLNYSETMAREIKELAERGEVDEIVQSDPNFSRDDALNLMDLAQEYHLDFKYAADMLGARRTNIEIKTIDGMPIIEIKKTPLDGWGRVVKRFFDIIGAIFFLFLFSPIFILLPFFIRLDSPGPIIYKNLRVGAKGKKFYLYKFRSMIDKAEKQKKELSGQNERSDGPLFKLKNDPRITKVGKFIRRTSIDEMPNFWNVLIGNMSLVGPRPHLPEEVARYEKHQRKLLNIKPGITGMAQVSGRSTLSFEEEAKLDTLYIETWSMGQDLIILIKTPLIILKMID